MSVHLGHPNSRPVTVHRSGSFLSRAHEKEETVQEYFSMANQSIGSYWESAGSKKVGSGLTYGELEILMPHLINCESNDRDFRQKVDDFFHEIDTKVPSNTGLTLETGMEDSNTGKISKSNLPLDIMDYVRWRQVQGHPEVGRSKKESDSSPLKKYYIFDPAAIQSSNKKLIEDKDTALQLYLQLKKEPEKIDMVITLLGTDPRSFTGVNKDDLKLEFLRKKSEENPKVFSETYKFEDLNTRYWLDKMVMLQVLNKFGTLPAKYIDAEKKVILGNTIEEAISWFSDPINSNEVLMLKARTQEAEKKPVNADAKRTVLTTKQMAGQ